MTCTVRVERVCNFSMCVRRLRQSMLVSVRQPRSSRHSASLLSGLPLVRHLFFASHVRMSPGVYDNAQFLYVIALAAFLKHALYIAILSSYTPPSSPGTVILDARADSEIRNDDELIDMYVNGPRVLSAKRTSYLYISKGSSDFAGIDYDMIMCFADFFGDGIASGISFSPSWEVQHPLVCPSGVTRSRRNCLRLSRPSDGS